MTVRSLLLGIICIFAVQLQAQNVTFGNLTTEDGLSQFSVNSLYIDENGMLWIGTREGLNRYNGTDIQTYKLEKDNPHSLFSNTVTRITGDQNGHIYLLCNDGVAQLDLRTLQFKTLLVDHIQSIYYHDGLYIAKKNEIYLYNEKTGNFDLCYQLPGKNPEIYCLHSDGRYLWIGTTSEGVYRLKQDNQELTHPIETGNITSIYEDSEKELWIGSWEDGLYRVKTDGTIVNFRHDANNPHSISSNFARACCEDNLGNIWIGTFNGGLYCIEGNRMRSFKAGAETGLMSDKIWVLQEDRKGNIWIGFLDAGIQCLNPSDHTFKTFDLKRAGLDDFHIASLCLTDEDDLIVGTASQGVAVIDLENYKVKAILHEDDHIGLAHNEINQVFKDSRGLIWIATRGGLDVYNVKTGKLKGFAGIMPDNGGIVAGVAEDANGDMWVTSARQLVHLNVIKDKTGGYQFVPHVYNDKDGLQNCDFNLRSICRLHNGAILVGGLYGINVFSPENVHYNKQLPKVFFTRLSLFNKVVQIGERVDGSVLLPEALNGMDKLILKYKQNIFTISLASDNLSLPEKTCYMYQLEGFNKEWLSLPEGIHSVTFTNLAPGNYVLNVKAVNSDGYVGKEVAHLNIEVLPPFWMSWWAYVLYVVAGIGLLFLARRQILKRERERFRLHQIELEVAKNEEVNNMKFRFFTNISHELRTPLTLIIAPLEQMLKEEGDGNRKVRLQLMYRNAHRLLMLVNQLLDFRKGEMSSHHLSLSEGDIISYIQGVCDSFLLMADKKQIHFSFFSSVDHFTMAFDADKMGKIVMNLLANAFKFTPEGGRVTVMLEHIQEDKELIEIKVADTGIGISDVDKEHIFDRFYQTENKDMGENAGGTGIGLSLVHDFVTLHGGSVTVFDNIGKGSVFVVHIPVKHVDVQYHPVNTIPVSALLPESSEKTTDEADRSQFPLLLVVDDNEDFRTFMESSLGLQYRVKLASNGKEAWNFLQNCEEMPDLVVSDIMMPEMDGNELCRLIKENKRTAHIPVILLSAKQTTESKVEGLSIGADDYVTKPFNMTILVLRIRKLIELSRYNASKGTIDPAPSEIVITSLDEKLIEKAIKYVEDNISRSDLSVEELSRELGMSRVHLYKKMLQITGKTPIEFIRVIRLKRAAQLLRDSQLHVSEIAFQVGFNNPKYFSRYFKEEFGVLPSTYQEKEGK